MSSRVIPADSLTQYQRWEPQPLSDSPPVQVADPLSANEPPPPEAVEVPVAETAPPEAAVDFPSAEELAHIHEQAQQDGFDAGLREGRALAEQRLATLDQLLDGVAASTRVVEDVLADQIVTLAIRLAEQVLRTELAQRPETLAALVREVTAATPYLGDQPKLYLHPDDLALLQPLLAAELAADRWQCLPDAALTRGGCRLDTTGGALDATLETRWQRVLAALGRSPD